VNTERPGLDPDQPDDAQAGDATPAAGPVTNPDVHPTNATGRGSGLVPRQEPLADPGLPEHEYRPTDVDPRLEKRAERQVAGMFALATLLTLAFTVAYFAIPIDAIVANTSALNLALGLTLGGALLLIGIGAIQWAKKLMDDHEIVEMRHPAASSAEDRVEAIGILQAGGRESGIGRRPLIRNTLFGAMAALGLPAVVLLADLGPVTETEDLEETVWTKGMRVVLDVSGEPLRPSDLKIGTLVNAEPAALFETDEAGELIIEGTEALQVKAKAAVILVRMRPEEIESEQTANWGVDGILCYSKICTHVGCPISLYEQQTHHVLCPCHQSTFDLAAGGKVLFGPAFRPLPQLPLGVDEEGYLVALSDFLVPVGPSYPTMEQS
jgi:ubiquinol-cytochrome c reductase iron-sulfur subunit